MQKLSNFETMAYYNPKAETNVLVDASYFGIGAIITQKQKDGNFKPVAYGSRELTPVEQQRYSQTERDALQLLLVAHIFTYLSRIVSLISLQITRACCT